MGTKGHHSKLTPRERDELARWKAQGVSNGECARRLGRHVSSIGRELKRNAWQGSYVAIHAQGEAWERAEKSAHGKQPLKNPDVYAYVTQHLREGWSPDQIAGRLEADLSARECHERAPGPAIDRRAEPRTMRVGRSRKCKQGHNTPCPCDGRSRSRCDSARTRYVTARRLPLRGSLIGGRRSPPRQ